MSKEQASTEKPSYSYSRLNTHSLCAYAGYLEYIEKQWCLGNYYTLRGNGFHSSRETNFRQKIKTAQDISVDDCIEAAAEEINTQINDQEIDMKGDELRGRSKQAAAELILCDTSVLIRLDHANLQPSIMPIHVEESIAVELLDEPFDLHGVIDVVTTGFEIGDAKTSKRNMTAEGLANNIQMTMYYKLGKTFLDRENPGGFLDMIYTGKKKKAYRLPWSRTEHDVAILVARFREMHTAIEAGSFPPCRRDFWKCDPKWCGHFATCKYVN